MDSLRTSMQTFFDITQISEDMGYSLTLVLVIALSLITYFITKQILVKVVKRVVERNKIKWDDFMYNRGVFNRLALLVPGMVIHLSSYLFIEPFANVLQKLVVIYLTLVVIGVAGALLNSVNDIYSTYESSKNRPIKGYLQVINIFIYVIGGIIMISVITGKSPVLLLSGLGALSAVIMLIFKDSILGLVAGVQLSANDMVRLGDWIEMPKFDADGDVIDISLNTVKVRNFDKTITTIPTYALVSNSFKNWRGMSESGGRRIKRSILVDVTSVHFLSDEDLDRMEQVAILKDYIVAKRDEIRKHNQSLGVFEGEKINGRHQTNLGLFRWYLIYYLKSHPDIHGEMTQLVRQRDPKENGLPLEIYAFTKTTNWMSYEAIQADVFDHILAVMAYFDLKPYQNPTGQDVRDIRS